MVYCPMLDDCHQFHWDLLIPIKTPPPVCVAWGSCMKTLLWGFRCLQIHFSYTSSYLQNKNEAWNFLLEVYSFIFSFLQMCCLGKKNIVLLNSLGLFISQSNARIFRFNFSLSFKTSSYSWFFKNVLNLKKCTQIFPYGNFSLMEKGGYTSYSPK